MKVLGIITICLALTKGTENISDKNVKNTSQNGLWKFISSKSKNDVNKIDECMIEVMKNTIKENRNTYMFLYDEYKHQTLLKSLQTHFMHTYYTTPTLFKNADSISFNHLIIFRGEFDLNNILKRFIRYQKTKFFITVKDYEAALKTFETLWQYRMVDVLVTFVKNRTVQYYTYFPYSREHCGKVGQPILVADCYVPNGLLLYKQKLFPKKAKNLYGCPVNITFKENIPSSYYDTSKKLTGWEVDLMNEIIKYINGVPNYRAVKAAGIYHREDGYSSLVKKSDVGLGLVPALGRLSKTDFCMYGQSMCTVWVVPKKTGNPHSAEFLTKVFPSEVWELFLLVFIVETVAFKVISKSTILNIIFKLFPYIFGMTVRTGKTSKLLAACWLWFCLIMNAIYQSGYQSTVMVPNVPPQLSTTREILQSNLKISGMLDLIKSVAFYYKRRYKIGRERLKLIDGNDFYEEWILRVTIKKDMAFLGFKEIIRYHIDRTELANKVSVSDSCLIKYMLAFILKKNSHLTEEFLKFSGRLNENGFVAFFAKKHLSRESRIQIPTKVAKVLRSTRQGGTNQQPGIDMDKMFVVFVCYFVGLLLALIVFCVEKISKWRLADIKKIFKLSRVKRIKHSLQQ